MRKMKPRIGFVYSLTTESPTSVSDLIFNIVRGLEQFDIFPLNVSSSGGRMLSGPSRNVDLWLVHNSASYRAFRLRQILSFINLNPKEVPIIVMKQDDHLEPYLFDEMFCSNNVVSVFTYLPEKEWSTVYPKSLNTGIQFNTAHTSYVTPHMRAHKAVNLPPFLRFSYRGGRQPVTLGELARDKAYIPEKILSLRDSLSPWELDFSTDRNDRLYGSEWESLIVNSYTMLSTESGSRAFDLDGTLSARTLAFEKTHGRILWRDTALLQRYTEEVLVDYEGNVDGGSFAPRNIELACFGRPQVLVEGHYGGLFSDGVNALFIKRDLENLPEVLRALENRDYASQLAATARKDVLEDPSIQIGSLLQMISATVDKFISYNSSEGAVLVPMPKGSVRSRIERVFGGLVAVVDFEFRSLVRNLVEAAQDIKVPLIGRIVRSVREHRGNQQSIF